MDDYDLYQKRQTWEAERARGWREHMGRVPRIRFKPDWEVSVIPPFAGADARFLVHKGEMRASVYLDLHCALGCYDGPYWEVYPVDGDVGRCDMEDGEGLLALISQSLGEQP